MPDDIRKALKDADPKVNYPGELRTATKAEFTTNARQAGKDRRPGCRLFSFLILCLLIGKAVLILGILNYIF